MTEVHRTQRGWTPQIPALVQNVFDQFPLHTYPASELPDGSPQAGELPTLHVFISETDARRDLPSYNPSCLKWQTFLRIAGVKVRLVPSNNHASPTGVLPFLLPSVSSDNPLNPIPSVGLRHYAKTHSQTLPKSELSAAEKAKEEAYTALLDTPIRNAWLYTLYLSPKNTSVLRKLYIEPSTNSRLVQETLLRQLRKAARVEILKSGGRGVVDGNIRAEGVLAAAEEAFGALETLLENVEDGRREDRWFLGADRPTLFDATVFSYFYLLLQNGQSWEWDDVRLRNILSEHPQLVAHARRIYKQYWGGNL